MAAMVVLGVLTVDRDASSVALLRPGPGRSAGAG